MPGPATIVANPYGPLSVQGATLAADTITDFQPSVVIQLGTTPGTAGSFIEVDFRGFNIGPGSDVTILSGAPGQSVFIRNADLSYATIAGTLRALGSNGGAPPALFVNNPAGMTIAATGSVSSAAGVTLDTLGGTWDVGQPLVNYGIIDGGVRANFFVAQLTGSGLFKGDIFFVATFGNANNPVNGLYFLSNGLALAPSSGDTVSLVVNDYGTAPQFLNFIVNGNAAVWAPSSWPADASVPSNNLTVPFGNGLPAGAPDASYGGGSMIVQSTGWMSLLAGTSNDFVFPGAVVLKAAGALDLNGVAISQGWTASGRPFQGLFFESPYILSSSGDVQLFSNDFNWMNFSSYPDARFHTWRLARGPDGSAQYVSADSIAPHLNTYSIQIQAAAAGDCWICLVNSAPINVQ